MIYIDAVKLSELVGQSGKTDKDFCNYARISKQAFYRLVHHGGPVMLSTLTRVSDALGVSAASLLDQRRTPNRDQAALSLCGSFARRGS